VVCTGTACYIKGSSGLLAAVATAAKIKPSETTPDKQVSLLIARCVGSCGLAPAVVFDGEVAGKVTPEQMSERVGRWMQP
jgi:bidirectional [NiFe] hydrogenase diaphorase subunit